MQRHSSVRPLLVTNNTNRNGGGGGGGGSNSRHFRQYFTNTSTAATVAVRRTSQQEESPYSKPYHSYRRIALMSSTKGSGTRVASNTTVVDSQSDGGGSIVVPHSIETRRTSGSQSSSLRSSPTKRTSERRLSSNGEASRRSLTANSSDIEVITAGGETIAETSANDSTNERSAKVSARKTFTRATVGASPAVSEQHEKQRSFLNTVRANTRGAGGGGGTSLTPSNSSLTRGGGGGSATTGGQSSKRSTLNESIGDRTGDESSTHSTATTTTPGTPNKRRRRHYKGGTYGLYLSKKRRKLKEQSAAAAATKKSTTDKSDTTSQKSMNLMNADGEESSQSFAVNSESDGELDGQSSDVSHLDEHHQQQHKVDTADVHNKTPPTLNTVPIATTTVAITTTAPIVVTEGPKRRGRRPKIMAAAANVVANAVQSPNKNGLTNDKTTIPETGGGPSNGDPINTNNNNNGDKQVFQLVSNNVNPTVVQSNTRKTLLKISTTGTVVSNDTITANGGGGGGGTQMGAEQSKFVIVSDKSMAQTSVCMCSAKPLIDSSQKDISKGKPLFCQAIDCFDEKLIGCCNQVRLTSLFRSSKRVPYRIFCEVHLARLRRHHCCPGCGLFCTQGEFNECFSIKKQIHLFHSKCQIDRPQDPKSQHCLHCDMLSQTRTVRLEMNGPLTNNTYYLQQTSILKTPKARIGVTKRKGRHKAQPLSDDKLLEAGIEYTIPATNKILSLAGLPFGPQRKQLEELLSALSGDKQSIRLTIQHNKNFYAVAKSGEVDKVLSILAQGFDPNFAFEDNDNETPLHAAAKCGHLLIVHLLIQSGANPNVLNKNMITPLMQSIEHKHNVVIKYLINSGASLDIRGEDGMTSLHISAKCGNIEAVHYILDSGKMNVNLQDDGGWSPLVWATEHKYYNIVKLLVNKGADPNIEDDEENVGLHWAAFSGETNIALLFLDMGAHVINQTNIHGDTPLHIAARRDNYECVVLLLSRGADITIMNKNTESPLQCAPNNSESEMALKVNQELKRFSVRRQMNSEKLLHRDLSKGKEYYQIQVVNGVDNEPYPIDFMYVTENCEASHINIDRTITSLQSCQCEDDCTSQKCVCGAISFKCWYDKEGKLLPEFNLMDAPMIFECNRACSCWKTCNNRVVQYGVRCRLQVFRTKSKGWGVRALRDIPKGTFVCEYVGEIISDSEADRREDDSYLFDLDNKDGETYCLDARFYGNICRFINHSCNSNLTPVKVFVDHQDLSFPRIALFSSRDIKAYEELSFDYGEKFWVIKYKAFTCGCGETDCKYNKDTIHTTIENYYKRLREEQLSMSAAVVTTTNATVPVLTESRFNNNNTTTNNNNHNHNQ